MRNNGGAAFPGTLDRTALEQPAPGMSLRDYFAAAALTGILAGWEKLPVNELADGTMGGKRVSIAAYVYADAMLAERDDD